MSDETKLKVGWALKHPKNGNLYWSERKGWVDPTTGAAYDFFKQKPDNYRIKGEWVIDIAALKPQHPIDAIINDVWAAYSSESHHDLALAIIKLCEYVKASR
jgi:hypothetical protein